MRYDCGAQPQSLTLTLFRGSKTKCSNKYYKRSNICKTGSYMKVHAKSLNEEMVSYYIYKIQGSSGSLSKLVIKIATRYPVWVCEKITNNIFSVLFQLFLFIFDFLPDWTFTQMKTWLTISCFRIVLNGHFLLR